MVIALACHNFTWDYLERCLFSVFFASFNAFFAVFLFIFLSGSIHSTHFTRFVNILATFFLRLFLHVFVGSVLVRIGFAFNLTVDNEFKNTFFGFDLSMLSLSLFTIVFVTYHRLTSFCYCRICSSHFVFRQYFFIFW